MPTVAIVGAGMSGMCMAIRLQQEGVDSFTIFEKADEVGGTWRENTYPGLECDVPSRYYSYTFAPNPDWTHMYPPGPEIQRYMRRVADDFGLRPKIRFGTEVTLARFVDGRWHLSTSTGDEVTADVLVTACGFLHRPRMPEIPGLETFAGAAFHSARWDHSVPLEGKRIAIVGTGSTGVQMTVGLAGVGRPTKLFQRTAQWVMPVPNPRYSQMSKRLWRRFPALNRVSYRLHQGLMETALFPAMVKPGWQRTFVTRACRAHLRTVRDPELRRRLLPPDAPMCKRIIASGKFYRAIQRPDVELVTEAIDHIEPAGIVTADGRLHELDVIGFATGFDAQAYVRPMEIEVDGGPTLEQAWADDPRSYKTVGIAGFPNYFILIGPHSPIGNQSMVTVTETQVDYIMHWIRRLRAGDVTTFTPTEEATERFNAQMRAAMPDTIWVTGCRSWYLGKDGTPNIWPLIPQRHRELLEGPVLDEHEVTRADAPVAAAPD